MSDRSISRYTSVFRASERNRIRRNRTTVSCLACQRRKSKCDRQHPCGSCEKRNEGDTCSFASSSTSEVNGGSVGRKEVQQKLNRLEEMIRTMADKPSKPNGTSSAGGLLHAAEEVSQSYHGATSWTSLVDNIRDIQDLLAQDDDDLRPAQSQDTNNPAVDIFFGGVSTITMQEVLDSLPSKGDCDRVVSAYFNAKFQAVPFLHTISFQRRYEAFWANPSSAGFLWISVLFSVLSAGAWVARAKEGIDSSVLQTVEDRKYYLRRSAQCLITGQYLKDRAGSVEALLMHAHARYVQRVDADPIIWALYGLVVRLAQRQGYHRDPAKVAASITPFEAEMRRRVWFMIQSADLLHSFQHGMPPVVYEEVCDVGHPTNLLDTDFDEDTAVLPEPRSIQDPTPILAYHFKSRLCRILRRIMRHALSVKLSPFTETMALNAQLDQWYAELPACLRIRSIRSTSFTDPSYTIMHRLMLELMYRKCQCVLHRPYLSIHKEDAAYSVSRQLCREAAMRMLNLHIELDQELVPGGRMYDDRFTLSSLTIQHFLIASTISCLDVMESIDLRLVNKLFVLLSNRQLNEFSPQQRFEQIQILQKSLQIWCARSTESSDAMHASKVLRAVLSRVDNRTTAHSTGETSTLSTSRTPSNGGGGGSSTSDQGPFPSFVYPKPGNGNEGVPDQGYDVNFDELPDLDSLFPSAEALNWVSIRSSFLEI